MRSSRTKVAAGVLAIMLLAIVALAQGPGGFHHRHDFFGGPMMGMFGDFLDLTDAQRTQINQIYENAKPTVMPLWQQERESRKAMMQLITSGSFDQTKAEAIANQASQVRAQLEVQHALLASQAYQLLTADQKTKLNDFMVKREQRFQERMQRHQDASDPGQTQDQ
jgi:Spy/CpxP family protein refolding chaperone